MGSYTRLTYHVVFATKYRRPTITTGIRETLYRYIAGTILAKQGTLLEIGGVADHIHLLTELPATRPVAEVVREVKCNSSKWVNTQNMRSVFEWQRGYGAFTVSHSQVPVIRTYIQNQDRHHPSASFRDEYMSLLRRHGISFREEYLFEAEHHG